MDQPSGIVELSIMLNDLPKMDVRSQTDAFVVVEGTDHAGNTITLGRTEVIDDCPDPRFVTKIELPYFFEWPQPLRFRVFDADSPKHLDNLKKQEHVGDAETPVELAQIMCAPESTYTSLLKHHGKARGRITVIAEQQASCSQAVKFMFSCTKLEKKDMFSSDPFLTISRSMESGAWVPVWKSDVVKKSLKPKFKPDDITLLKLANGDADRPIKITVMDWDSDGTHDFMGEVVTSCRELEEAAQTDKSLTFTDPNKKTQAKREKSRGHLHVVQWGLYEKPTFANFLKHGLQLHLSVAIDFTASNGPPSDPRSLHYMGDEAHPNEYIRAIRSVARVVGPYDPAQRFRAIGFGANINGAVSHNFLLAGGDGTVEGAEGVESVYRQALANVTLSGPTLFAQFLTSAVTNARARGPGHYDVMLVLTDGVVMDTAQTIKAIVDGSDAPLSIIIIGVGGANFDRMDVLDADTAPLTSGGKTMARDIVQFVAFRSNADDPQRLAAMTLAELPQQVEAYQALAATRGVAFL